LPEHSVIAMERGIMQLWKKSAAQWHEMPVNFQGVAGVKTKSIAHWTCSRVLGAYIQRGLVW
jgi:hypothetical protein